MKKVKKQRKIVFLALACSLLMSLVCVNAFAGSMMYEGAYQGGYYQTRISLNSKNGGASLQYGKKALLRIKGEVSVIVGGRLEKMAFSEVAPKATETSCVFVGGGNYRMVDVWSDYYVNQAKLQTMYTKA